MNEEIKHKGVGIIEVLFIVAIIIILAGISVLALNGQRAKARDAKRASDVRQIQTALEFYYSDESEYPIIERPIILGAGNAVKLCSKNEGGFVDFEAVCNQASLYMAFIPKDPSLNKNYTYTGSDKGYDISFTKEKEDFDGLAGIYHAHSESTDLAPGIR
jgi:type II secretory pathway pseudopilin PulG